MAKFRKKPVVVEAEQWFPPEEDADELPMIGVYRQRKDGGYSKNFEYYVLTIHMQRVFLSPGDWVIRESDGEHFYPCKPDIFEATYEPVKKKA